MCTEGVRCRHEGPGKKYGGRRIERKREKEVRLETMDKFNIEYAFLNLWSSAKYGFFICADITIIVLDPTGGV